MTPQASPQLQLFSASSHARYAVLEQPRYQTRHVDVADNALEAPPGPGAAAAAAAAAAAEAGSSLMHAETAKTILLDMNSLSVTGRRLEACCGSSANGFFCGPSALFGNARHARNQG